MEIEIKDFAPVLIPTLNRYEHFKRCVESLAKCTHAEKTELIIGLDYPPAEKYVEGWERIKEYLPSITGFKKVTILRNEYNLGAIGNIDRLKLYSRNHYDRFIFTEDDNEFAPNFLDYINKGLEEYKDNPRVLSICGYNYHFLDLKNYSHNYYFAPEMSAWGYGSWFNNKTDFVEQKIKRADFLLNLVKELPLRAFLKNETRLCNLLYDIGQEEKGDAYYTYYELAYNMLCVFPKISLVRNSGHDGSGIHCGNQYGKDVFSTQLIDSDLLFQSDFKVPIIVDDKIRDGFKGFRIRGSRQKVKNVLLLVLMKLFIKIRK